ncbi:MAG: AMP-binding protein [Pseudonocardia sp.]|uniref:AMP-binding protein n=1 Tax=unclassified Pseudonocardia TaxID=2619320 RepID=UPI00086A0D80|nr:MULTISPECIES: AMP-binding protein [unclassified Pseudonocardia]MBN9112441.1 AMP-binding protein [Pseudonocardia sp.]ODU27288.1 MAG: acetate--CoA ligase [Pseudonocardia sp. SCN 72-51]ODV08901.1 MAG: acetate--CoA ligase [Pseudonocardia sp. SCN 73-27]
MARLDPSDADREWVEVARAVDRSPFGGDFNTGHEVCSRYSRRSGVALTVVHPDGSRDRWTYGELDRAAARLARVLHDNGLRPGDRVAGLLSRQVETWIVAVAAWRSGLVFVPLFGGFGADAIGLRMVAADVHTVVADSAYLETLDEAMNRHSLDPFVLACGRVRPEHAVRPWLWDEIDAVTTDGPITTTTVHDLATILFTSGTTGAPKGCAMPHGALLSVLPYVRHVVGGTTGSVFSTADPGWAYGLYTTGAAVLATGRPLVVYSGTSFVPENWHRVAVEEAVTVMATAPSAVRRLTSTFRERGFPPRLGNVVVAGEPLTEAVAGDWAALGAPPIRNGYGLSEIGMVLADTVTSPTGSQRPGSLAGAVPGFDAYLAQRDGRPVAPGEPGLVAIRRPRFPMSTGYVNAPDLWAQRWVDDVYVTEDRAVREEPGGAWTISGRDDDIMVIAGHNISPVEVESAVLELAEITEAAAVSHHDAERGAVVKVVAVADQAAAAGPALADRVRDAVSRSVGKFAVPRVVEFASALPRTEVGKLRRAALREKPAG